MTEVARVQPPLAWWCHNALRGMAYRFGPNATEFEIRWWKFDHLFVDFQPQDLSGCSQQHGLFEVADAVL